jgi:hypothetical protein
MTTWAAWIFNPVVPTLDTSSTRQVVLLSNSPSSAWRLAGLSCPEIDIHLIPQTRSAYREDGCEKQRRRELHEALHP